MATKPVKKADDAPMRGTSAERRPAIIPVIQEQATVRKRVVETGRVSVSKQVREYEEVVDIPHIHEEVKVERRAVNEFVDEPPRVRTEGETTIIPVLEERYVVEKRLFLVEELHVRKDRIETHHPQTVKVLKEEVSVKRSAPGRKSPKSDPSGRHK